MFSFLSVLGGVEGKADAFSICLSSIPTLKNISPSFLTEADGIGGSKEHGQNLHLAGALIAFSAPGEIGEDQSFMPQTWLVFRQVSVLQDL